MALASYRQSPITLSQDEYLGLMQESMVEEFGAGLDFASDQFDFNWSYPPQFGNGHIRDFYIREGLVLSIVDYAPHQDLVLISTDREHPIELNYILAGAVSGMAEIQAGQHGFYGSGMAPSGIHRKRANQHTIEVSIHLDPTLLSQWVNGTSEQLPPRLKELVKPSDQLFFSQICATTLAMQMVLQQILQCPFQGLTQQMYLESKVWELMALQLAQLFDSNRLEKEAKSLKPEDIERIHYAKEVLCSRLCQPPSLMELARIVGINDCKLKAGFRQVFGTTVFGYLHSCRMERSRQLLEAGEISVTGAARAVGFVSRGHFAAAFKRRFGVNPSAYMAQKRQDERFLE
jgi:AraC-like DNA-binding protein